MRIRQSLHKIYEIYSVLLESPQFCKIYENLREFQSPSTKSEIFSKGCKEGPSKFRNQFRILRNLQKFKFTRIRWPIHEIYENIQRVRKTTRFTVIHQIIYEIYKIYSEGHKEVPNKNYSN